MVLAAHSDASYLTEPNSRSRAGAHIFLTEDDPIPRQNGPIQTTSQVIKYVMASAAEAELTALQALSDDELELAMKALSKAGLPGRDEYFAEQQRRRDARQAS